MKHFLGIVLCIHGLIHFFGYFKAFLYWEIPQITQSISKPIGMLFLFTGLLFIVSFVLVLVKWHLWFAVGLVAVISSQILLVIYWHTAKYGTFANTIIFIAVILSFASWKFRENYEADVHAAFAKAHTKPPLVTLQEATHLPLAIQKYLKYVGVVEKPEVLHFKVNMRGEMRGKNRDWFSFSSQQHNFIERPTRLFFMEAKVKGLPTAGYHYYSDNLASMHIKLLSIFPVLDKQSPELFIAETVTFLNDLCLFAPAALVDKHIRWEEIDEYRVKAYFSNQGITIEATLYFNEDGQLINFVSDDRYDINAMKKYRFSTPVSKYKDFNGYRLPSYGETIWHYQDGEFIYGKFEVLEVTYTTKLSLGTP